MKNDRERRIIRIDALITKTEAKTITEAAKREGKSRTQYLVEAALERASGDVGIAKSVLREEIKRWPPEMKEMMAIWAK